jgi:hypothetical protein
MMTVKYFLPGMPNAFQPEVYLDYSTVLRIHIAGGMMMTRASRYITIEPVRRAVFSICILEFRDLGAQKYSWVTVEKATLTDQQ